MDEDCEENIHASQGDELQDVLLREQQRNAELKEYLSQLLRDNAGYKKKYNELQQRLSSLNDLVEKNARIFQELFDDTKGALQMGTVTKVDNSSLQSPENNRVQNTREVLPRLNPQRESDSMILEVDNSPLQSPENNRVQNTREVLPRPNPQPGPSGVAKRHSKVDIERLNLKELEQSLDASENRNSNSEKATKDVYAQLHRPGTNEHLTTVLKESTQTTSFEEAFTKKKDSCVQLNSPGTNEHLTTILEELTQTTSIGGALAKSKDSRVQLNSSGTNKLPTLAKHTQISNNEGALAKAKDVRVRLSRLPYEIVQEHLHKQEAADSSVDLTMMNPNFTSTPLKLETMKGLGLRPSVQPSQNQFINTRRNFKKAKNDNSPPKQRGILKSFELKNLVIDTNEGKEIGVSLNLNDGRPSRRTRPQQLREPNLKRKIRRS